MTACACSYCVFVSAHRARRALEAQLATLRGGPIVVSPERGAVSITRGDQAIEVELHEVMPMLRAVLAVVDALEDAR